jgi:hypothetical protein
MVKTQIPTSRKIRVFFASPGDVEEERHIFIDRLRLLSDQSGHQFIPLEFSSVLAASGRRPQSAINNLVDQCDIFLAVFYRRWGQYAPDVAAYTAYTEEEFERANRRFGTTGAPEILCFFKQVDLSSLADPGSQLTNVLEFRRRLEESRQVLYRTFTTMDQFVVELDRHLMAFANGEMENLRTPARRIHLPIIKDRKPEVGRAYDLAMMREAIHAAESGHLEDAATLFARLSQTSRNIEVLDITKKFFEQADNQDAAQAVLERKLTLLHDRRLAAHEYMAVFMSNQWLDDLIASMLSRVASENRGVAEQTIRKLFTGTRFRDLMIKFLAEHFTVGELLSLARYYRGEGGSIMGKFGHFMGIAVPEMISILQEENPELFSR